MLRHKKTYRSKNIDYKDSTYQVDYSISYYVDTNWGADADDKFGEIRYSLSNIEILELFKTSYDSREQGEPTKTDIDNIIELLGEDLILSELDNE
jgi:hypothetical protein